mgnify:FL=1
MNQPRNNHDSNPYESTQQTPPQGEQPETPAGATQAHGSQAGGNAGMSPNDPAHSAASQSPQPDTAASPVQAPGNADPAAVPQTAQQPSVYAAAPQAPYAQPSYGATQPPANPYATAAPKPAKKWPWVLLGCALAFLMGLGGCVGFATVGMVADSLHSRADGIHSYDFDDLPYGHDPDDLPDSDYYGGFTLSDIKEAAGDLPGDIDDEGKATPGVYVVGRDIDEGLYFLQGNTSTESEYYLFDPEGFGTYSISAAVTYTGNYFADLENGQVVAFMPSSTSMLMIPADQADFQPQAPYASGLYRVGKDIPAGTYSITVSPDAPHNASQDYAAYVMKDLDFDDDSITDSKPLLRGSTQTVTVEDGEWLELFGTIATPVQ